MKAFNGIIAAVGVLIVMIFAAANISLNLVLTPENGRPYRVEINRAALEIREKGSESIDLTKYVYINNIVKFNADSEQEFYNTNSEYAIREIDGNLYRFDYSAKDDTHRQRTVVTVNIILGVLAAAVLSVLLYIKKAVLQPFERLTSIPYALSKGNLTAPLKESKNRFFGKFLWGIDLLRENIEQRKQRELELQREKKTLLLSLSHDIKTPLSAIKLYSRALSKNLYPDAEKQRETAENINAKADEIERYVSQIIGASREDFLSLDVKNGEFYLSDLIQSVSSYYREKTALVKTDFRIGEYGNCMLFGDLDRGIEVLQNVVENAMKYGDGRLIELNVSDEDEGVLVSVKNSGCTLDKKELPHIFESFWRGANTSNIQGSGLGLYICRELMRKMNGEFFAEIEGEFMTVTAVFVRA
ncbi:MAG: HAMP domain-containing histidine kinase [Ruminococcaceae bacterium]|nr:HAMP domain-containing histidine kinase [Oscillospiraceae bacterium]